MGKFYLIMLMDTPIHLDSTDAPSPFLLENLLFSWQQTLGNIKHSYATTADSLIDEFLLTISQAQINDALYQYVVRNVKMLHHLHLDLHEDYLRLTCTVDVMGIYATVASDFQLVQIQLNKHSQRLVLKQISPTDVLELHTRTWYQAPLARFAVGAYRALLRKDPLPFILSSIKIKGVPFTEHKGNVIYLEIGRWLTKIDKFADIIRRVQVNHGILKDEQLLLRLQPNFGEILSFGDPNDDIITAKDKPKIDEHTAS